MIYGATGYTARLVTDRAVASGLRPILAGRSPAVEALAARHGLPSRVFDLRDPQTVREAVAGCGVVAHCAGPFSATSGPMIDACLAAGADSIDITGEIDVFEAAQRRDAEARAAGVVLCPGVGFDVIPTDCIAATLAGQGLALSDVVSVTAYLVDAADFAAFNGVYAAERQVDARVFCAGVARDGVTHTVNGGRVITVTGRGATFDAALKRAYRAVDQLSFEGMQVRRDIGHSVLRR
jgi:hypothetical protein